MRTKESNVTGKFNVHFEIDAQALVQQEPKPYPKLRVGKKEEWTNLTIAI